MGDCDPQRWQIRQPTSSHARQLNAPITASRAAGESPRRPCIQLLTVGCARPAASARPPTRNIPAATRR